MHPHAKFKPCKVKFYAAFKSPDLAQDFERYLKSGSGHAFAKRHLLRRANLELMLNNPPAAGLQPPTLDLWPSGD